MYGAWKNYSCTGMRMCVHICTSMCACECVTKGLYIDSKEKRACNRVPIKRHSKAKNSNKSVQTMALKQLMLLKILRYRSAAGLNFVR